MSEVKDISQSEDQKMIKILSMKEIEDNWSKWDEEQRRECCLYQKMSIEFLSSHSKEIDWPCVSINPQTMGQSWEVWEKFHTRLSWTSICLNKSLADNIIYNFRNKIVWNLLLSHQHLNIKLLIVLSEIYRKSRAKAAKDFWKAVSRYEKIDHEYVDAYKRFIDFEELSKNPNITPETIRKFLLRLNPKSLMKSVDIPKDILKEHIEYFSNLK